MATSKPDLFRRAFKQVCKHRALLDDVLLPPCLIPKPPGMTNKQYAQSIRGLERNLLRMSELNPVVGYAMTYPAMVRRRGRPTHEQSRARRLIRDHFKTRQRRSQ